MFLDTKNPGPRPEPYRPQTPRPKLSPRDEKILLWVIGFNVILMLVAPIGGATVIDALFALVTR